MRLSLELPSGIQGLSHKFPSQTEIGTGPTIIDTNATALLTD